MVVEVQPSWRGISAGLLGVVGTGVGPAVGQGSVEAFDLAVDLRPVGRGALVGDVQVGSGVGLVGRPVVGLHPLDDDATVGEPGRRAAQDGDGVSAFSSVQISA